MMLHSGSYVNRRGADRRRTARPGDLYAAPPAEAADASLPCKPEAPTPAVPAKVENACSAKRSPASAPYRRGGRDPSGGRHTTTHGAERPPPPQGSNCGRIPTPQNLRDNPERRAKVKTEMCSYYEAGGAGSCPFGANCNYAHGKHELKNRHTTLLQMESCGRIVNATTYLSRPCMTWVSTGACPFGRRCAGIHDPSISGSSPSWLPAAMAKTNAHIIVDRHGAHRDSVVHQENPLISQNIWDNCRPSKRGQENKSGRVVDTGFTDYASMSILDMEQVWSDTYALVCNGGVPAFDQARTPSTKLSDLQKLCIVRLMRSEDGWESGSSQLHRDYVFSPTHSLHSELCTNLQARYFRLLEVDYTSAEVSAEDVVKEISYDEYKSRTTPWSDRHFDPSSCVSAHEVAFGPKGDPSANVSIWFDVSPVELEPSQVKRSRRIKQKKKTLLRITRPNSDGALISRTCSADFPGRHPDINPFVPMLPAEDGDDSQRLIMAIIEHQIDSIILKSCSSLEGEQEGEKRRKELYTRMKQLQRAFLAMAIFHTEWTWPKSVGMGNVTASTTAPPQNVIPYIPMKNNSKSSATLRAWRTFVDTMQEESRDDAKRLSTFLAIDGSIPRAKLDVAADIPRILPDVWWSQSSDKSLNPWREILLGMPSDGNKWETALRLHNEKQTTNQNRNTPLSTIPFVQP